MTTLATHFWCMELLRDLESADPGRPIGQYFAQAVRYVRGRVDDDIFYACALRHLRAGCPTPKLQDNLTTLSASAGGLTLHA